MLEQTRDRLLKLFRERAFSFGQFTLKSGKKSSYYINSKKALFHSEAISLLAEVFWHMTKDLELQAIGGPEVGAIPIATALAQKYHQEGRDIEGFFVRKQLKEHGSKEWIEGVLQPGWKVGLVEDVLTTGGSAMHAIEKVEKAGAQVVAVLGIVDRLEGARQKLEGKYQYLPIFDIRDFGIEPPTESAE
ncbi:MAG: orotate phosphoribosyltransferase [Gemmataceae bacterium]